MRQIDMFSERIKSHSKIFGEYPKFITIDEWEYEQLKKEVGPFLVEAVSESLSSNAVLYGVPIRVSGEHPVHERVEGGMTAEELFEIVLTVSGEKNLTTLSKKLCISRSHLYEMKGGKSMSWPVRKRIWELYPEVGAEAILSCD